MQKGNCAICGNETKEYVAHTEPLSGFGIVIRNARKEVIAQTTHVVKLSSGVSYLVIHICKDHNYWISNEYIKAMPGLAPARKGPTQ